MNVGEGQVKPQNLSFFLTLRATERIKFRPIVAGSFVHLKVTSLLWMICKNGHHENGA